MPHPLEVEVVPRNRRWEVRVRGIARPLVDWFFTKERAIDHAYERAREVDARAIVVGRDRLDRGGPDRHRPPVLALRPRRVGDPHLPDRWSPGPSARAPRSSGELGRGLLGVVSACPRRRSHDPTRRSPCWWPRWPPRASRPCCARPGRARRARSGAPGSPRPCWAGRGLNAGCTGDLDADGEGQGCNGTQGDGLPNVHGGSPWVDGKRHCLLYRAPVKPRRTSSPARPAPSHERTA